MLIELISGNAYLSVNKKLITILGMQNAVYLSHMLEKAYMNNSETVNLSRKEIESIFLLTVEEQRNCEVILNKSNIIEFEDNGSDEISVKINASGVTTLLTTEDPTVINKVKKSARAGGTPVKGKSERQQYKERLKYSIKAPNDELLKAYQDWVDGVYANPSGFLSKRAIESFQKEVDEFAKGDLDLALKIIEIAAVRGYKICKYAVNVFNAEYAKVFYSKYRRSAPLATPATRATLSNEVF